MQIGSFMGGLSQGFNTGNQMRDAWEKRQNAQYVKDQIAAAQKAAAQDAGTVTEPEKIDYRVAGLGSYADELDAKKAADDENVINEMRAEGTVAPTMTPDPRNAGLDKIKDVVGVPAPRPNQVDMAVPRTAPAGMASASVQPPLATVEKRVTPGQTYSLGKTDWQDVFYKQHVPEITARLMQQGRFDEATAYENLATSREGKVYGKDFMEAITRTEAGDYKGAVPAIQRIFNRDVPNGQRALVIPAGDKFRVRLIDEKTRAVVSENEFSPEQLAKLGVKHLQTPEGWMKYRIESAAAEKKRQEDLAEKTADRENKLEVARISAGARSRDLQKLQGPDGKDHLYERDPNTGKYSIDHGLASSANNEMMSAILAQSTLQSRALAQEAAERQRVADETKRVKPYNDVRNVLLGVERVPKIDPVTKQAIPGRFSYLRNGSQVVGDAEEEIGKAVAAHIQLHGYSPWPSERSKQ